MQARAQFPPEPRSASVARHWVRDHLTRIGRTDLVPAAEAGVSELVTNGILHARTSIGLLLTRDNDRVVIEVYDGSPMTEHPSFDTSSPMPESTIGRGLRLVRAHAQEWGVSTRSTGKSIWFQPVAVAGPEVAGPKVAGPEEATPDAAGVDDTDTDLPFDLDAALDALADAFPDSDDSGDSAGRAGSNGAVHDELVEVRLLGVPPSVVQHYRKRWLELVREMQLVALGDPSPQHEMARRFSEAAQAVDAELYVLESTIRHTPTVSDDDAVVDAVLDVRSSRREAYVDIRELARQLERQWAGERLLFVHPGPQAAELREWWLNELIAQIDGAEPTPWTGGTWIRDEAMASGGNA